MSGERLGEILGRFPRLRVAVIGDYFLDKYLDVDPSLAERSIETGKTAHQVVAVRHSPGAAGTVVSNMAALGAGTIHAVGFTGDDGEAYDLRADLARMGCNLDHFHREPERMTPTYLKPRDKTDLSLSGEHSRYDTKNRTRTSPAMEDRLLCSLETLLDKVDAVVAMDQVDEADCGAITERVRQFLAGHASRRRELVFWADSRRRIRQFRQVIIKPNQFEALGLENPPPGHEVPAEELRRGLEELRGWTGAPIFATCGAAGIVVTDPELTLVPAVRVEGPIDPTGAGDSVTAGCVLALAAGAAPVEAALIGNLVASITIQQLATTGVARPEELLPRLDLWLSQHQENP